MKHLCFSKLFLALFLISSSLFASVQDKSAIVYYGEDISYSNVGLHDYIIVESDNISPYTHGFKTYKKKIYAYVSIGEASKYRKYFSKLDKKWIISENHVWNSKVMDISNDDYHEFLYSQVIQKLVDKGYENFFFDTLDSYQIVASTKEERKKYELGLIRFIKKFKQRFPKSKLIVNRGFEVIQEVYNQVDAVLVESVFYGLSSKSLDYIKVTKDDRFWLIENIKKVQSLGLDVIALDYIDIDEKDKIKKTVENIKKLNIIPYIANKELTRYGSSSKNPIKREVLIVYNTRDAKETSNAHVLASMPLEYLGYIPVLKSTKDGFFNKEELSRYKAVLIWTELPIKDKLAYLEFLKILKNQKIKVFFMDGFGLENDKKICDMFNIQKFENLSDVLDKQKVSYKSSILNYETDVVFNYSINLYKSIDSKPFLELINTENQTYSPLCKTKWGGYSLSNTSIVSIGSNTLWVINPFALFKQVLNLDDIPVPDVTTENGRRLLFTHIDGDGSMNRVEWNPALYSIDSMYKNIIKKYKIPQTVSIVESELDYLYPKDSKKLEAKAKKIFNLPYVKAATHTYTHPFYWTKIKNDNLDIKYRLKVKDYNFSIDREVRGSLNYINKSFNTNSNTVFWTGDCMPQEDILKYVYKNNYLNINGGETTITNDKPWLSLVSTLGLKRGEYLQIYTGAQNENVYTNDWLGPFWGFKKVIQTFKLTNKPRRLKPIDIYYHFYSASKTASLRALDEVYKWALTQDTRPIYISEYIPKVMEFYDISMYTQDSKWHFNGMKELKTVRVDKNIDIKNSRGVIGKREFEKSKYVHLDTSKKIVLKLSDKSVINENYLVDSNGMYKFKSKNEFNMSSYVNLKLNYHLKDGCEIKSIPKSTLKYKKNGVVSLDFKIKEADFVIKCR